MLRAIVHQLCINFNFSVDRPVDFNAILTQQDVRMTEIPMSMHNPDHTHLCADCHTTCSKRGRAIGLIFNIIAVVLLAAGAVAIGSVGWFFVVLILGAASFKWEQKAKCAACGSTKLIPIDSPAAKKLLQ